MEMLTRMRASCLLVYSDNILMTSSVQIAPQTSFAAWQMVPPVSIMSSMIMQSHPFTSPTTSMAAASPVPSHAWFEEGHANGAYEQDERVDSSLVGVVCS